MNLTVYVESLLGMGIDIPNVITEVTRIIDSDGLSNYIFSMDSQADDVDNEDSFSGDERQTASIFRDHVRTQGGQMEIEELVELLEMCDELAITHERALALAKTFAVNGVIK